MFYNKGSKMTQYVSKRCQWETCKKYFHVPIYRNELYCGKHRKLDAELEAERIVKMRENRDKDNILDEFLSQIETTPADKLLRMNQI